ncbi:hypothetical protein C5167_047953 [Papaver somniferum]|uniref:Uncharacterized protein n=1 Tax=Papaver somniferum TaxID=3469 RepID=A0A4Y7KJB3_PAPSO|nr:hypothetical protein C5167_047953 [Papaver somniferum]
MMFLSVFADETEEEIEAEIDMKSRVWFWEEQLRLFLSFKVVGENPKLSSRYQGSQFNII